VGIVILPVGRSGLPFFLDSFKGKMILCFKSIIHLTEKKDDYFPKHLDFPEGEP